MGKFRLLAGLAVLALVAAGCGKTTPNATGSTPPASQSPAASPSEPITNKGTKDITGTNKVTLELHNDGTSQYFFNPTYLKAKAGQKLTLTLKNTGTFPHNFSITAMNISQDVAVGQTVTITLTLPATGDVQFFCQFHHAFGMRGAFFFGSAPQSNTGGAPAGTTTY
jgi:plastocyanin